MSQDQIDKVLKKRKTKWFSSKELKDLTGLSQSSVCNNLKKMRRNKFINWRSEKRESIYYYRYKQ